MKILIVDDHPVVRQGIRQILAGLPGVDAVIEAVNAASALEQVKTHAPELMVLDLNLPDRSGFHVLTEMRQSHPETKVLILSIQPEKHLASSALKAGAHGYVNKDSAPEELLKAVSIVLRGGIYVSPRLAEWLAAETSGHRESVPHERLSDREFQVLCLLAAGKSIGEISTQLKLNPNTVSTYRARILEKMGIENNAGLTRYALSHYLID